MLRSQHAAETHVLFREVNDRIARLTNTFRLVNPTIHFVCECANDSCTKHVSLTSEEYGSLRQYRNRYMVVGGDEHVWFDVERVVTTTDSYWIVEPIGQERLGNKERRRGPRSRTDQTRR